MRKTVIVLLCAAAAALTAGSAVAADNGFYLGASVGQTTLAIDDIEIDVDEFDFDADDTSYKIFVGYRILTFFAVEGSYVDFGRFEDGPGDASLEADLSGFNAFAMGMLPLGIADIFVKAGAIAWDADLEAAAAGLSQRESESGTDPAYGVGAQFRIRSFAVRAEVEFFDVEDADDLYMISVWGSFTF
jgi:hypothetical protein